MIIISLCLFCGQAALAQPVERTALNRVVVGSIPTGGAFLKSININGKYPFYFVVFRACLAEWLRCRPAKPV